MNDMDKISSDERTIKIGKALIVPDVYLDNPLVIASYQGYSEILKEITYLKNTLKEMVEVLEFYGDEKSQIPPEYRNTGKPQADFTAPYRMDGGKRARALLQKHKELIEGLK